MSPEWWIIFVNFACRKGHEALMASTIEIFLMDEVAGPKFTGPIPLCDSRCPIAEVKSARERIKNCSQHQLEALLPRTIVFHKGEVRWTQFATDGLSKQVGHSQVLSDVGSSAKDLDDCFGGSEEDDNAFSQSLTVGPQHSVEATPR
jgi:hypothetical protein